MTQSAIVKALANNGYSNNPDTLTSSLAIVNGWDSSANVPEDFKGSLNICITVWTYPTNMTTTSERMQMMIGNIGAAFTCPIAYRAYTSGTWSNWVFANRNSQILANTNFDSYTTDGVYGYSNASGNGIKNAPANYGTLVVFHTTGAYAQLSIDTAGTIGTRSYTSSGWSAWNLYNPDKTKAHV